MAQDFVSVRAGLIHHVSGEVFLDATRLREEPASASSPTMKNSAVLRVDKGKVEVLLSPGVVVRMIDGSALRMVSNSLTDTRLELLNGSAMLEVLGAIAGNTTTISFGDTQIIPRRPGYYRIGGAMPEVMCYDGAVDLVRSSQRLTLKRGRAAMLHNWKLARKFDPRKADELVAWSVARSEKLADSSRVSVAALTDQRRGWRTSMWRWDPTFGMFGFIPASGYYCGYFGSCFYAPQAYYTAFVNPPARWDSGSDNSASSSGRGGWDSGGGYATTSQRSYDPPAVSSAPAASAPAPSVRSSEGASSRGSEGGGRSQ
jgi:hypothetical protein